MSATLLYVADPMCSWCWGFAPVLASVTEDLRDDVSVRYVMGGLAPDSDEPMEEAMKEYIRGAWRSVTERAGVRFNWSYWEMASPRRSTWPACRAVLAAGDRGVEMFAAIQKAYYEDARDPSDKRVLIEIGGELGFDRNAFGDAIDASETRSKLEEEFRIRDSMGVRGYPSVGVECNDTRRVLTAGWAEPQELRAALTAAGLLG